MAKSDIHPENIPIDDEWIRRLMEDKLSASEESYLSENREDSELFADAVEGLQQFETMKAAHQQVNDINRKLLEQLKTKPREKKHTVLSPSMIVWITIIFILVLVFLAYYLIKIKGY